MMLLGPGMIEAEARENKVGRLVQCVIRTVTEAQFGIVERGRRLAYPVFDGSRGSITGNPVHCLNLSVRTDPHRVKLHSK